MSSTPDLLLSLKPIVSALILPPVPFVLLMLAAVRLAFAVRRRTAALLALLAGAGLWLSCCTGTAVWLQTAMRQPPPLGAPALASLQQPARHARTAIVVLGGGLDLDAPEYGQPVLTRQATMRLLYGLWLARQTGLPVGFSGGVGWAQHSLVSEAEVAARLAKEHWHQTIRWQETRSRDTRENARWMVRLLQSDGIREVVLVTHAYHMNRAVRAFREAAGETLQIVPAPMGFVSPQERPIMNWLPTTQGYTAVYDLLHEVVGWWAGA